MSSSKKPGMKKPDGTREKGHYRRTPEIYPTRVNNKNISGGKSAHVPENNLYVENTYTKFEDGEETFYEQQSATEKKKCADIVKGEGTKTDEFEPNLSANEDAVSFSGILPLVQENRSSPESDTSCESTLEGERNEENHSSPESDASVSTREGERNEENRSSPESDMSCESQPFDDLEGDLKASWTSAKGEHLKTLENACISYVFDFYNICVKLAMRELKRIGIESLKSKLSKYNFRTVLDFADKNNETELRDYTLAFISINCLEFLDLEKYKVYLPKDPVKADPVSFPGILAGENHLSPESDTSCELTREGKRKKGWTLLMNDCLEKLKNRCISDVFDFYNIICVNCKLRAYKRIVVESLRFKLSKSNLYTVLTFAQKNNETELQDYAVDFFFKNYPEILKSEEWKKYLCEDHEKANDLIIRAHRQKGAKKELLQATF